MPKGDVRYMWNGIKVNGQLYRAWYSFSRHSYQNDNDPHITMYAKRYADNFPGEVRELFTVRNETDSMTDYFEKDSIRLDRTHPEWEKVAAAYIKQEIHGAKTMRRRGDDYSIKQAYDKDNNTEAFRIEYAKGEK